MKPKLSLPVVILAASAFFSPANAQIAVTEFLNNPTGDDTAREFFELYNYSSDPVNLINWTMADEDSNSIILSEQDLIVPSGGYLVFSVDKTQMESDYFGGLPQINIIAYDGSGSGFQLANGGDELVLSNADANVIWSVAYTDDDVNGRATFLSENNFSTTVWGSKEFPGIIRAGIDPATGTLGYESNDATTDPNAITNDNGDTASPLAGLYTVGGGGGPITADFRILSIVHGFAPGAYDITFESELGESYSVDTSPDLSEGSFTQLVPVAGADGNTTVTVNGSATRKAFYRVRKTTVVVNP